MNQVSGRKLAWCFLEIEANTVLLELRWRQARHRSRSAADSGGRRAILRMLSAIPELQILRELLEGF